MQLCNKNKTWICRDNIKILCRWFSNERFTSLYVEYTQTFLSNTHEQISKQKYVLGVVKLKPRLNENIFNPCFIVSKLDIVCFMNNEPYSILNFYLISFPFVCDALIHKQHLKYTYDIKETNTCESVHSHTHTYTYTRIHSQGDVFCQLLELDLFIFVSIIYKETYLYTVVSTIMIVVMYAVCTQETITTIFAFKSVLSTLYNLRVIHT